MNVCLLALFLLMATVLTAEAQHVKEIDLKECVQLRQSSLAIIDNDSALWSAVRKDGSQERCITTLQQLNIDLAKNVLIGANINSGHCRRPPGLKAGVVTDNELLASTVRISYTEPEHGGCAALSSFVYWILVPKPPPGFTIKVDVGPSQENLDISIDNSGETEH